MASGNTLTGVLTLILPIVVSYIVTDVVSILRVRLDLI